MIYIALLRGINVGGKNIIKMAELKKVFENLGFQNVQSYIQSGNVLFISDKEEEQLRIEIETTIERTFGFPVAVILRTLSELETIIAGCPFTLKKIAGAMAASEGEVLYVSMFSRNPSSKDIGRLIKYDKEGDEYKIAGRDIYLLFCKSIRNSKLAGSIQKTDVPFTSRNFRTISKLAELGKTMK
ncbi:DUF1697 domain-containing protein [Dysgonomonas termitidis]|uniref:DUF1697 domain-containing protein n=1 Tax=Dysgonomonas termitidis TaxID=1516126 RepID=A0ABV9KUB2_9BACT